MHRQNFDSSTLQDVETVFNNLTPGRYLDAFFNERVSIRVIKVDDLVIFQSLTLTGQQSGTLSNPNELTNFMLLLANVLKHAAPPSQLIQINGSHSLAFDSTNLLIFLRIARTLSPAILTATVYSAIFSQQQQEAAQAQNDVIDLAKWEAAEHKQDWTKNYNAPCIEEYFSIQKLFFLVEVIKDKKHNRDCRFASQEDANAFLKALLAENICDSNVQVKLDTSYRQNSNFQGKNVYTLSLNECAYEVLLSNYQSTNEVEFTPTIQKPSPPQKPIPLPSAPPSESKTSLSTLFENEAEEVDSEEEKVNPLELAREPLTLQQALQTSPNTNPSLAIYQHFGTEPVDRDWEVMMAQSGLKTEEDEMKAAIALSMATYEQEKENLSKVPTPFP